MLICRRIERGRRGTPTLGFLTKLGKAYGVAVPELLAEAEKGLPTGAGIVALTSDAAFVATAFEKLSHDRQKLLSTI